MNTAILNSMTEQLTRVFNDPAQLAEYQAPGFSSVSFGWDGRELSPVTRAAYVKTYGADTVERAEQDARARLAETANSYEASAHAAAMREAREAKKENKAPAVGAFVLAVNSGLKADGGLRNELRTAARDPEWMMQKEITPRLVKVLEVYEVSAEDFARPSLADELVQRATNEGREFPGGAEVADEDANRCDPLNEYRYYYTLCAAVVCRASGRWFLIDAEGYSYARYIYMPTNWREQFAAEYAEEEKEEKKEQERREAEEKRKADEKAARLADYVTRCAKYDGLLQDVRPLQEAESKAGSAHGWSSKEYRQAARDLMNAQKKNLQAMGRAMFPGLKITVKKSDRYRGAYDITYYDGPRLEKFDAATDYDLFISGTVGRDYWGECDEYHHAEFTEFAEKYMAISYGNFETAREWSKETRARLVAQVSEAVPALAASCYESPYKPTIDDLRKVAEATGANTSFLIDRADDVNRYYNYIDAERVARWCFDSMDLYTAPTEPEKPRKGEKAAEGATAKDESREATTATATGLRMEKYSEKATVIRGYNQQQRAALLEMGGRENFRLQGGKGVIFSTRKHGDALAAWMKAQQAGEGESPAAAAADTLHEADEITAAPVEGSAQYYAEYLTKHADKAKPVILRTGSRYHVLVFKGDFWDLSNADGRGTQYDVTTDEAADVLAEFYKDAQRAPLYEAEEITRTAQGTDRTADGLEFRAVVVGCESREIEAGFLTLEDAHAAGWYGFKLDADPAEVCHGSEGYRGGRLLLECCREEDAGTLRIAYGETYEQAAANYRAGRFGLSEAMKPTDPTPEPSGEGGKINRYIVAGGNTLGYITGTQEPGKKPVSFVVMAVNVEAGGDPTLIDRETVATDYRPATREDENTFNIHLF